MKQRKLENRYQDTLTLEEQVLVYHMELSSLSCMLERSRSLKVFKTKKWHLMTEVLITLICSLHIIHMY